MQTFKAIKPLETMAPFRHSGFNIYPWNGRWAVQSIDNLAREQAGERQVGGDSIVDTKEKAIAEAEFQVRRMEDDARRKAELDAQRKAELEARQAIIDEFADFVAFMNYSAPNAEKARNTLQQKIQRNGKIMTNKAMVTEMIDEGYRVETYAGQIVLAHPDGRFLEQKRIGKTAIDYTRFLESKVTP